MIRRTFALFSILLISQLSLSGAYASDEHDHDHDHGHGHEEEEALGANVGPEKGILEMSESKGFRLSPEAASTFRIQTMKVFQAGSKPIPGEAFVHSGDEVFVYRARNGFFKRVHVEKSSRTETLNGLREFAAGDEVVTRGARLLRVAELDALSGESHGHSH